MKEKNLQKLISIATLTYYHLFNFTRIAIILVSGTEDRRMAMESCTSLTLVPILENLTMAKLREEVDSIILMEIFMSASGEMIKLMVMASILLAVVFCMKESGRMICEMEEEKKLGLMEPPSKAAFLIIRKMERVSLFAQMDQAMLESSEITESVDRESCDMQMEESIKVDG